MSGLLGNSSILSHKSSNEVWTIGYIHSLSLPAFTLLLLFAKGINKIWTRVCSVRSRWHTITLLKRLTFYFNFQIKYYIFVAGKNYFLFQTNHRPFLNNIIRRVFWVRAVGLYSFALNCTSLRSIVLVSTLVRMTNISVF